MSDPSLPIARLLVDGESCTLLAAAVHRGYSTLGWARCEIERGPDPAAIVGKPAVLTLERADGGSRMRFGGLVTEASSHGSEGTRPFVALRIEPRLARLGQRRNTRVFQQQGVPEIVTAVLAGAGIAAPDQQWQLADSYPPRRYCVQHRETDLGFVQRLLSEEGIGFVVEHDGSVDRVCFADGPLGDVDGAALLPYRPGIGAEELRDCINAIEQRVSVTSDRVTLRDYDPARPDYELRAEQPGCGDGPHSLESYVFPARTASDTVARHYARVLVESLEGQRDLVFGQAAALHLGPGRCFTLTDHPYEPLNRRYLVVDSAHRFRAARWGTQAPAEDALAAAFTAVPVAPVRWRPPRLPRARAVGGYDSARVVGPAGAEIHPAEHAEVKAQLIWDREGDGTDRASCWMRTTQPALAGGLLVPRVGWEVMVQNVEGDPDQPVVTGRLYTAKAPPPYPLPEHKSRSVWQTATSPGGGSVNEVSFDDRKGAEQLHLGGSRDSHTSAGHNATETVGGNETRSIAGNQALDVTGAESAIASSQSWTVGGSETLGVGTYLVDQNGGAHALTVGGARNLTVGGDHRRLVGGASSLSVGGMQVDLVVGHAVESVTSTMSDSVGAALIELCGGGRSVAVGGDHVEDVGAVKAVLASGGRGVEVGASLTHDVAGAIAIKTKGDLDDNSKGALTDVAGGAQIVKATEVTFTAKSLLTVVCGGSTLTLTPASVTLAGATIKLDGACPHEAALVKDN